MTLNGEISSAEEEEEKQQAGTTTFSPQKVVVGYALTSKKKKSFLQPSFTGLALNNGIYFVPVDLNKSLPEQGPFDVILHKLSGEEWREIIEILSGRRTNDILEIMLIPRILQTNF